MAGFTETLLIKRLRDLNNSSQSIQTLSLWLIHHRKHHVQVVKIWYQELFKGELSVLFELHVNVCFSAKANRKLTLMYLANDIIQNSKKKGPEYGKEFAKVLKGAFEHMSTIEDEEKTKNSLSRLLSIWVDRAVYDELQIAEYRQALCKYHSSRL